MHILSHEEQINQSVRYKVYSISILHMAYYFIFQMKFGRKVAILARFPPSSSSSKKGSLQLFKPNIGLQSKLETVSELKIRFRKVLPDEAKPFWEALYKASENKCAHIFW